MNREFPDWSLGSRRYSCLVCSLSVGRALAAAASAVKMVKKLAYMLFFTLCKWTCIRGVRVEARLSFCCDDDNETGRIEKVMMSLSLIDIGIKTSSYLPGFNRDS